MDQAFHFELNDGDKLKFNSWIFFLRTSPSPSSVTVSGALMSSSPSRSSTTDTASASDNPDSSGNNGDNHNNDTSLKIGPGVLGLEYLYYYSWGESLDTYASGGVLALKLYITSHMSEFQLGHNIAHLTRTCMIIC